MTMTTASTTGVMSENDDDSHHSTTNGGNNNIISSISSSSSITKHHDNHNTYSLVAAKLARPNIVALQPYRCARDDYSIGTLLDANENAYGPPMMHTRIIVNDNVDVSGPLPEQAMTLERYPDPYQIPLKEKYLQYRQSSSAVPLNLTAQNVFCGVGSDEAIDLLMRIFCTPGRDHIITTPPTYGMYAVSAKVNDVAIVPVPLSPTFDVRIPEVRCLIASVK
jgi:histidinol-phosphate aminotransferase